MMVRTFVRLWIFAASLALLQPARAEIVADFSGGNGTDFPDQYVGTAGDGWTSAWSMQDPSPASTAGTVTNTDPLTVGGGNYLQATDVGQVDGFTRRYGDFDGIDISEDEYLIQFDMRIDGTLPDLTGGNRRIQVQGTGTDSISTGNSSRWAIFASNGPFGLGDDGVPTWGFMDLGASNFVNSNIQVIAGNVYRFSILDDPANLRYSATVWDMTDDVQYSISDLQYRAENPLTDQVYLSYGFQASSDAGNVVDFSLDNIRISAVPEPSGMALLMMALAGCALARFRRRGASA